MRSFKFIISGKVQGVYYRKSIHDKAIQSSFSGYVKNLTDGTVEATVTCKESRLNDFILILQNGSEYSRVDNIKQFNTNEVYQGTFKIQY